MERVPKVSIGMPAFNAEAHIGAAIESLLGQTYGDFELIISDNASTDGTRDVIERYLAIDARIRYERQATNVGANPNYRYVARLARGDFFKWSSSSDWCAPSFLDACIDLLVCHCDTVLAVPRTRLFEQDLRSFSDYDHDLAVLGESPSERIWQVMGLFLNNAMNGVIRCSALRRTRPIESFYGGDVVLLGGLALLGKFRLVEERLFYRRMQVATATSMQDEVALSRHHYPEPTVDSLAQFSRVQLGWLRVVGSAPIEVSEKFRALKYIAKRCYWERHLFKDDVRGILEYLTRGVSH
jgi:hypothetical protein